MSLATYGDLKTTIADWMGRADLATTQVPDFVTMTTARLNRTLRTREMLTAEADYTADSSGRITTPTDFLQVAYIRGKQSGDKALQNISSVGGAQSFPAGSFSSGRATAFTVTGSTIQIYPQSAVTVAMRYYQQIPALTTDGSTNWLLTKHPDVYLYGSLLLARAFVRDLDIVAISAAYDNAIREINADAINQEWAGANVNITAQRGMV